MVTEKKEVFDVSYDGDGDYLTDKNGKLIQENIDHDIQNMHMIDDEVQNVEVDIKS